MLYLKTNQFFAGVNRERNLHAPWNSKGWDVKCFADRLERNCWVAQNSDCAIPITRIQVIFILGNPARYRWVEHNGWLTSERKTSAERSRF